MDSADKKSLQSLFQTFAQPKIVSDMKSLGQNLTEGILSSSSTDKKKLELENSRWNNLQQKFFEKPLCFIAPKTTDIPMPFDL